MMSEVVPLPMLFRARGCLLAETDPDAGKCRPQMGPDHHFNTGSEPVSDEGPSIAWLVQVLLASLSTKKWEDLSPEEQQAALDLLEVLASLSKSLF
jgi:hypothetical protein